MKKDKLNQKLQNQGWIHSHNLVWYKDNLQLILSSNSRTVSITDFKSASKNGGFGKIKEDYKYTSLLDAAHVIQKY